MDFWQRVHWFATPECNERCRFCFKPDFEFLDSPEVVSELAHMLVEGGVKEVVYTGGEPTLLRNLSVGLDVLHNAGVDTSIHTNATTLTPKKRDQLVGIVDEVAVPIDSMNRQTQKYLRKMDCLPKVMDLLEQLQNKPVRIEIHTVATSKNIDHIPKIYEYLQGRRFDSWRIY
jgi:molybdenum cofactor biosynthesis enzyme MoaA